MYRNGSYYSEYEILRMAERERAKAIAGFFRRLLAAHDEKKADAPAHAVPAE